MISCETVSFSRRTLLHAVSKSVCYNARQYNTIQYRTIQDNTITHITQNKLQHSRRDVNILVADS